MEIRYDDNATPPVDQPWAIGAVAFKWVEYDGGPVIVDLKPYCSVKPGTDNEVLVVYVPPEVTVFWPPKPGYYDLWNGSTRVMRGLFICENTSSK